MPRATVLTRSTNAAAILSTLAPADAGTAGPAIILLVGLPGTGKSTFAQSLASLTGALVLESDRFRQLLFGAPVFSTRESGILFRAMVTAARALVREGRPVIIDATNLSESDRRPFYRLSDSCGVPILIAVLEAPQEVIEHRLASRDGTNGYSLADIGVYHRMRARTEDVSRPYWRIDTNDDAAVEAGLTRIAAAYREVVGKGVT